MRALCPGGAQNKQGKRCQESGPGHPPSGHPQVNMLMCSLQRKLAPTSGPLASAKDLGVGVGVPDISILTQREAQCSHGVDPGAQYMGSSTWAVAGTDRLQCRLATHPNPGPFTRHDCPLGRGPVGATGRARPSPEGSLCPQAQSGTTLGKRSSLLWSPCRNPFKVTAPQSSKCFLVSSLSQSSCCT